MIKYIRPLPHFKRDVKSIKKKHFPLNEVKRAVHYIVIRDFLKLRISYDDHALFGNLKGYRDLHVKGFNDLVLIYQVINDKSLLILVRIGSHDNLFK